MLVYDNGKSACRVAPGLSAESVHKWRIPPKYKATASSGGGGGGGAGKPLSRTALADPRSLNVSALRPCAFPCILHFVTCGLEWLTDKYTILGAFEDAW